MTVKIMRTHGYLHVVALFFVGFFFHADSDTLSTNTSADLINIAVLTLKNSDGITPGDAALITDRLNVELFRTARVNLLERNQIKDILKEQGFQGSGVCSDEACLVEMGQILGVREIITGSLGRLGTLIVINLRTIDVAKGQIVKVVSQDISGKLEDVIYYLPNIARKLVGLEPVVLQQPAAAPAKPAPKHETPAQSKTLAPTKNTGMLQVVTQPEGAEIVLNGKTRGPSPLVDNTLLPGKYTITISYPRYETYTETFLLAAGYTKIISRTLAYKYGILTIASKPDSASVSINDIAVGMTPFYTDTMRPGEYRLSLSLQGYRSIEDKFIVRKHVADTLSYTFFSDAQLDSVKTTQWKMNRGRRNARRVIFGMLAAGAWGTGIYFNHGIKQHTENAQELYDAYSALDPEISGQPVMVDEWEDLYNEAKSEYAKAKDKVVLRNILNGTGGLFTLFFTLSIPF
jgi:TolB-like protein